MHYTKQRSQKLSDAIVMMNATYYYKYVCTVDEEINAAAIIVEKSLAIMPLSLPEFISSFTRFINRFYLSLKYLALLTHYDCKNKTVACHPGDSSSLHSVDQNAAAQDAHNNNNNGQIIMGSWAEVVLPVQTADARSNPATSRRRTTLRAPETRGFRPTMGPRRGPAAGRSGSLALASSVGCEPVSRPDWVVSRSHRLATAIHLAWYQFRGRCTGDLFQENRYTRDNFRRLNRCVSESLSRQDSIIFSVRFLLFLLFLLLQLLRLAERTLSREVGLRRGFATISARLTMKRLFFL